MKNYIKEGLEMRLAPPAIYDRICRALENPTLSKKDREELMVQKEKAEQMALRTKHIFRFPNI